jgi:hypothetical protein
MKDVFMWCAFDFLRPLQPETVLRGGGAWPPHLILAFSWRHLGTLTTFHPRNTWNTYNFPPPIGPSPDDNV